MGYLQVFTDDMERDLHNNLVLILFNITKLIHSYSNSNDNKTLNIPIQLIQTLIQFVSLKFNHENHVLSNETMYLQIIDAIGSSMKEELNQKGNNIEIVHKYLENMIQNRMHEISDLLHRENIFNSDELFWRSFSEEKIPD